MRIPYGQRWRPNSRVLMEGEELRIFDNGQRTLGKSAQLEDRRVKRKKSASNIKTAIYSRQFPVKWDFS